jgi:hypothetical protein
MERKTVEQENTSVKRQSDSDWNDLYMETETQLDMIYNAHTRDRLRYNAIMDRFRWKDIYV